MHRPSNVDDPETLTGLVRFLADEVVPDLPLVWPVHPRTWNRLEALGLASVLAGTPGLVILEPVGYLEMLRLNMGARVMFTGSGGLQEECCVLGTPCLTMRWNTERPVTLAEHGGASYLVGNDVGKIRRAYAEVRGRVPAPHQPPLWDGKTAVRIAETLSKWREGEVARKACPEWR